MVEAYFRRVADIRLTQLLVALRCYHLDNARLPTGLDELVPKYLKDVPLDPFTEKPLLYEPEAEPPRVRSVGPDQKLGRSRREDGDDQVVEVKFAVPKAQAAE
jgi:hypothetical protein